MDYIYWLVGFLVLANGATIITVFTSAIKVSSEFGQIKERVKSNTERIERLEEV